MVANILANWRSPRGPVLSVGLSKIIARLVLASWSWKYLCKSCSVSIAFGVPRYKRHPKAPGNEPVEISW